MIGQQVEWMVCAWGDNPYITKMQGEVEEEKGVMLVVRVPGTDGDVFRTIPEEAVTFITEAEADEHTAEYASWQEDVEWMQRGMM